MNLRIAHGVEKETFAGQDKTLSCLQALRTQGRISRGGGELCSIQRCRPLELDNLEAEVYRLGFCRFIRWVLQSFRSRRLSESAPTIQSEQKRAIPFWPLWPQTLTLFAGR